MKNKTNLLLITIALLTFSIGVYYLYAPVGGNVQAESVQYTYNYNEPIREVNHISNVYYPYTINQPDIQAHDNRVNACRTYPIGGYDMTDGLNCGSDVYTVSNRIAEHVQDTSTQAQNVIQGDSTNDSIQDTMEESTQEKVKNNNGHGNNDDGVDCSNPGKSKEGRDSNPAVDDEKNKGKDK